MHYINGLSYGSTSVELPDNIPTHIDYIPQEEINRIAAKDQGKFAEWLQANPEFEKYGKQAIDIFLSWLASRNNTGGGYSMDPNMPAGYGSSHSYPSTSNKNGSGDPKSNTTRNILIGTGVLLAVFGGIALSERTKKK